MITLHLCLPCIALHAELQRVQTEANDKSKRICSLEEELNKKNQDLLLKDAETSKLRVSVTVLMHAHWPMIRHASHPWLDHKWDKVT